MSFVQEKAVVDPICGVINGDKVQFHLWPPDLRGDIDDEGSERDLRG